MELVQKVVGAQVLLFPTCEAASFKRLLGGGENAPSKGAWKVNDCEERRRIKVSLTGLIYHAKLAMLRRIPIRNDLVDLATLQGHLIPLVA